MKLVGALMGQVETQADMGAHKDVPPVVAPGGASLVGPKATRENETLSLSKMQRGDRVSKLLAWPYHGPRKGLTKRKRRVASQVNLTFE